MREWMQRVAMLVAVAVVVALLGAGTAYGATSVVSKRFDSVQAQATVGYWTADRLANARPMPMPQVSDRLFATEEEEDAALLDMADQIDAMLGGAPGAPPERGMKPDFSLRDYTLDDIRDNLSHAMDEVEVDPNFIGPVLPRGYFSSSRVLPTTINTVYPYRAVGKLFFTHANGGSFVCSGAVIRPRLVLTAGHCVHKGSGGSLGWHKNFSFRPGFRSGVSPFLAHTAAKVWALTTWTNGGGTVPNAGDWGLIQTNDINATRIGNRVGYFGYQYNALQPNHVTVLGYPANHDSGQLMHVVNAQPFQVRAPNCADYGSDMRGGSSGGPIVMNFGQCAAGQTNCSASLTNRIVSCVSYGPTSTTPLYQGASEFQTSGAGNFQLLLSTACANKAGNC